MGEKKKYHEWNGFVPEINTMIDPGFNKNTGRVFSSISKSEMVKQIMDICIDKRNAILSLITNKNNQKILSERLDYLMSVSFNLQEEENDKDLQEAIRQSLIYK